MKDSIRTASTTSMIGEFRDEVKKFREIFTKHFGPQKVTEKIKNDHLCLSVTKKNEKGNLAAEVELHVELKVLDELQEFAWLQAELEGDVSKKEFQAFHEDMLYLLFNCKKKVDEHASKISAEQLKSIGASSAVPKAFTDKEWKRTKNMTLTDTGIGEAIRAFEKADAVTKDPAKRTNIAFKEALLAAKKAYELVQDTIKNLDKNKHEKSTHALRELGILAKKEMERLLKEMREHEEFVAKWERERHDEIDQLNLWEREIRGYKSSAVVTLLLDLDSARESDSKQRKLDALAAGKKVLTELKRIKTEGANAYETVKLRYVGKGVPIIQDWSNDVAELARGMQGTLKKIEAHYKEIAESVFKEMQKVLNSHEELKLEPLKKWLT